MARDPRRRGGRLFITLIAALGAEAVNKVIPLLILRFVVARIGVEGFGFTQFSYWLIDMTIPLVVAGYAYGATVELGRLGDDQPAAIGRILSEVTTLKLIHAVVAWIGLLLIVTQVTAYAKYAPVALPLSFIILTTALDMSFVHVGTQRMMSLSLLTVGVKILSLGAIFLAVRGPDDQLAFALLYFGANGIIGLGNFLLNIRRFPLTWPDRASLLRRFWGAAPYAALVLGVMAFERFDVLAVERLLGTTGAGLYGGPIRVVQSLANLVTAIGLVFFAEIVGASDSKRLTERAHLGLWAMLALVLPTAVGAWFIGGDVLTLILGEPFRGQERVFALLLMGLAAHCLVTVFGLQVLLRHQKPLPIAAVLLIAAAFGLGVCRIVPESLGTYGIALANVCTRLLAAIILTTMARPELTASPKQVLLQTAGPALGMGVIGLALRHFLPGAWWTWALIAGLCYLLLLAAANRPLLRQVLAHIANIWQRRVSAPGS